MTCTSVNKHYIPPKGLEGTVLRCVLPAGHEGDHEAPYKKVLTGGDKLIDSIANWSDAANVPVDDRKFAQIGKRVEEVVEEVKEVPPPARAPVKRKK